MLREFLTQFRFFLRGRQPDRLDDELAFHIQQATERGIAEGLDASEARRQAVLEFGGLDRTREDAFRQHPGWFLSVLLQDLRYALRGFRRRPLFPVVIVLTMTLGIGATTAVFSIVDRILFRSLPYDRAEQLVSIGLSHDLEKNEFVMGTFYYEWRDKQTPFTAVTSQGIMTHACDLTESEPVRLACIPIERNFLPTFGINPVLGRNFLPEESRPGGPSVALISYALWQTRYHHDPSVLNKLVELDSTPIRIIGVLPESFELPTLQAVDILTPYAVDEVADRAGHPGMPRRAFARLKPGVTVNQAKLALTPLFAFALNTAPPGLRSLVHLGVRSLRDRQMESMRLTAWTLFATVLAVLLIACANVASLLLARGAARERELATRYALGASRGRLVRQALTESLLLALASALAGCIVASLLLHAFLLMAPSGMLLVHGTQLDLRVISFTVILSMLCGIGFGILPALHKPSSLAQAASTSLGSQHAWLRQCLVAGQIAISIVLLSGASLLLRSLWHLQKQDLGMQTRNVLTVNIALSPQRYDSGHKQQLFYQQLKQAFANLPGVSAVAVSSSLPPGDQDSGRLADLHVPGRPPGPVTSGDLLSRRQVTSGYFQVLDIPIVRGRAFTTEDEHTNQREVIFSQSLAARILPGTNPVGREVQLDPAPGAPLFTVVGIAGNVKNGGITGEDTPEYYRLRRDADEEWEKSAVFLIETDQSSTALAPWVRSAVSRLDAETPVDIQTMKQQVSTFLRWPRFEAMLLAVFAFAGLTMAVIGLYGVTSFLATQRVKEIGVRMAVGATRINILLLMMQQGTRIILIGTGFGLAAAFLLSRFVRNSLYGVSSHDPASFIGVSALLALVAFAATMLPAYAAMKIEPTVALRHE